MQECDLEKDDDKQECSSEESSEEEWPSFPHCEYIDDDEIEYDSDDSNGLLYVQERLLDYDCKESEEERKQLILLERDNCKYCKESFSEIESVYNEDLQCLFTEKITKLYKQINLTKAMGCLQHGFNNENIQCDHLHVYEKENKFSIVEDEFNMSCSSDIKIIYTSFEERIKDARHRTSKTIANTAQPKFVFSRVFGYMAEIALNFSDGEKNKKHLIEYLINRTQLTDEFDYTGITYSISGKLPHSYMADDFELTKNSLNTLSQLTDEKFYANLPNTQLLRAFSTTVDLQHYFTPILLKLAALQNIKVEAAEFGCVIKCIVTDVQRLIRQCAQKLSLFDDDRDIETISHLQNIYKSFLLDKDQMLLLFARIKELTNEENIEQKFIRYLSTESKYENDSEITIHYRAKFAIHKTEIIPKLLKEIQKFVSLGCGTIRKKRFIIETMTELINGKIRSALKQFESTELAKKSLEGLLKKNLRITHIDITEEATEVTYKLFKNGSEISPALPLLSVPIIVRIIQAKDDNIIVKWNMESDKTVTAYKLEYSRIHNVTRSSMSWKTVTIPGNRKTATISFKSSGKFAFRVQAYFGDIFGPYSKETIRVYTLNDMKEETSSLQCSICYDQRVSIAFDPCGHIVCENCAKRFTTTCPHCRKYFIKKMKLFFS